jgi:hypothetical protein
VREHLVVDMAAAAAQRLDGEPEVVRRPRDDGVRGQGETPRLLDLLLEVPGPDGVLVGVGQVALERVRGLALVELARDLAPICRIGGVAGGVDRSPECAVSLSAAARAFCRPDAESFPTSSDAVACPNFSDPARRSRSS